MLCCAGDRAICIQSRNQPLQSASGTLFIILGLLRGYINSLKQLVPWFGVDTHHGIYSKCPREALVPEPLRRFTRIVSQDEKIRPKRTPHLNYQVSSFPIAAI